MRKQSIKSLWLKDNNNELAHLGYYCYHGPDWFRKREWILLDLGFATYKDYISSSLWHDIRKRVLDEYGNKCSLCGQNGTIVHHKQYDKKLLWEII